ncbi:MAG: leucine-rich repeat protein, partial [Clostridia bacterium]|nr:leucine-rich repeat protein [Clostridia bacterium]
MKKKSFLKIFVFALSMLFSMALVFGITGAAYNTARDADGSFTMAGGIVIDYTGFGKAEDGEWESETTTTFKLFADSSIAPGATINLNAAGIKKGSGSIDFFARIKLSYKFYNSSSEDVTESIADYSAFITTPTFNSAWVDGNAGDGWFYYATGTTLNALPASYVDIFTSSPAINIALNAEGFNHQGGGYKYSSSITITKIEAVLTLEAVQIAGSEWEIIPQYTDAAGVVYTQNQDETWTLTDGTALSSNSSSSTATYSARIYTSSYSYTVLSQINNQDVVAIGDAAFLNAAQLTAVEIPTTISTIGSRAFEGTGLTTLTLPESVEEVGTDALAANSLTEVTIENDQAVVTGIATAGIPSASAVNVPSAVLNDYQITLSSYSNLKGVGPSVGLAYEYDSLTQSYTITGIGTCLDTEIVIPKKYDDGVNGEHSVTSIGEYAFFDCTGLTSIEIPNSVTSIGDYAFYYCYNLTSIEIPNSVTSIGEYAFIYCYNLTSIEIPNSVTSIGRYAFYDCIGLTSVTIGSSVTSIGSRAFSGCTGLTQFVSYNTKYTVSSDGRCLIENYGDNHTLIAFAPSGLTSYTIPDSVTSIGEYAFYGCHNLTSIEIPNSVTSIGSWAFYDCIGLTQFVSYNTKYTVSSDGRCLIENYGDNHTL